MKWCCIIHLGRIQSMALFKMTKTGNAIKHLVNAHPMHPSVDNMLKKKKADLETKGSFDSVDSDPRTEEAQIKNAMYKQSASNMCTLQVEWLTLNSIAHKVTQSPEYLAIFWLFDHNFVSIASEIFLWRD